MYQARTLFKLMNEINVGLYLPHIQRPFVWDEEQMQRLLDSLMRNYPIQTFLFWRTKDAIKARRFMQTIVWDAELHDYYDKIKSDEGIEKTFVLDGQQRIQTLYALFNGTIQSADGQVEREACIDITSGHTQDDAGLLYRIAFAPERQALPWYRLRDLLGKDAQKNAEQIAEELNDVLDSAPDQSTNEQKARERLVRRNVAQLVSLLREEKFFWVQELDGIANEYPYKRVLDIFVRVNSGGTKLGHADLMFAAMKEGWSDIEQNIEEIVDLLNGGRLNFDKELVLKCIVVALGQGADLNPEKFTSKQGEQLLETIQEQWSALEEAFEQLRDFTLHELRIYSDKAIRSYNSFVPLFDYLYHNPKPDERSRALMRGYYYKSQLFNWYRAQTDQLINLFHRVVGQPCPDGFPLMAIKERLSRVDTELSREHLSDMRLRFIILNLVYVYSFGASPFDVQFKGNEPHIDHIYPQSMLRSKLGLPTVEINALGNYRFLGATDNIRKRAELPISYFSRLKASGCDIQRHLLLTDVADDPTLLAFDVNTYRAFRDRRCDAIFDIANQVVNPELI